MIDVEVKPRADKRYDIYVRQTLGDEPLVNSSQGYENRAEAVYIARKLFAAKATAQLAAIRAIIDAHDDSTALDRLLAIQQAIEQLDQDEQFNLVVCNADKTVAFTERIR